MTLTDFLLARIAEDEERILHDRSCDRLVAHQTPTRIRLGTCACGAPTRFRADCEVKRRLVLGVEPWSWVLTVLATVYADHPDYRAEWRP